MTEQKIPPADAPRPHVLVTGGPTAEDIDPVRFITNRSTGRMGIEMAGAVARSGGTPLLILGPTHLAPPDGVAVIRVRSAMDMRRNVLASLAWADSLVMSAAVADYTPSESMDEKLKKKDGDLLLRLKRTPDILQSVMARPERAGRFIVGFSLDVGVNLSEGRRKLIDKDLDLIVVNTVDSFGSDRETACLVGHDGEEKCGRISKGELAEIIMSRISRFFAKDKP